METLSRDQTKDQGQQNLACSTHIRPLLTAEQLAESAASHDRTEQMKKAPEPFAKEEEAPARRTEELQSTGIQNQRFLAITPVDQSHPIFPAPTASNQESSTRDASPRHYDNIQPMTSTLSTNADLHEQLQKEIRKEFELLYDSRLVKRTADLEAFWRGKREERTKEVENYWKQKLTEVVSQRRDGESTRELHEQIEKLKTRLEKGPGLIKAAEERGRRQGELDGFNKLSLNPELKPSQDRLNFEFLMKEKNKEIAEVKAARDNWFRVARKFSGETIAKLREQKQQILRLQTLVQDPPPQKPSALDNAEVLIAAGQKLQRSYDKQTQELVRLQEKCNQQAADLANLKARLHHRSEESSNRDQKLGDLSKELHKKTKEVSILRRESDQKSVKLSESTEQLEKKSREISILQEGRQEDLTELEKNRQQ
ncbi:hypothetical protein MMC31_006921, partial [Peltigera leucophlebia]|nr:hypothetical protein [Peltigera leucophlebia]